MSSFLINDDKDSPNFGDLEIVNNSLVLTTGLDAIKQHITVKFRLFLGEWFLDTGVGVPWYEEILVKRASFAVVQERLKAVILETSGILELIEFQFDFNAVTRHATLKFRARTVEGNINFSQLVET